MAAHEQICLTVPTLLLSSVRKVVGSITQFHYDLDDINRLPIHIKDKCLTLMSKRGLLTDSNISTFLHKKVQKLDLSECEVTDAALTRLSQCPDLRKIDLNSAKDCRRGISNQGIITMSQHCPQLQVVYLRRCVHVSDDAIIALSQNCRMLRDVNLGGCVNITDRALTALGQNSHFLKSLNISRSHISDNGIFNLVSGNCAKTLKELHMNHCENLTDESVEAITQFCPHINILIFHACPHITEQARMALEELTVGGGARMKQVTWTIY